MITLPVDLTHVAHLNGNFAVVHHKSMRLVDGTEHTVIADNPKVTGKRNGATTSISTETLRTIRIVKIHVEIFPRIRFNEHNSVTADAEFAVAQMFDLRYRKGNIARPIIDHDKIVSGALIFVKG